MNRIGVCLVCLLAVATTASANTFVEIAGEARLPLPQGWTVDGSVDTYPVRIAHETTGAALLVFQTELEAGALITDEVGFEVAVDQVIDSVVLRLPDAILLTSTGFQRETHAGFVVEFVSMDSATDTPLEHRLAGIIYRHPDNFQLLFTLWGKAPESTYTNARAALEQMQEGFQYVGPAAATVFAPPRDDQRWWFLLLIGIAAVLFIMRRRRSQKITTTGRLRTWRCACGRLNHIDNVTCRSCNQPRRKRFST